MSKVGYFLIFTFMIGVFIWDTISKKKIKKSHVVICANIISVKEVRLGPWIEYVFFVDGKEYHFRDVPCTKKTEKKIKEGDSSILVVAEKGAYYNSFLLENSSDFENFNVKLSDTVGLKCRSNK